jgi:SOS response regulatory protein OraA/RecX
LAKALRKQIMNNLGQKGMSRRQAEEALDADVRDLQLNIRKHLTQKTETETFPDKKNPASEGKD